MTTQNELAIFDNGGGITLKLGTFAHHYQDVEQAARDWKSYSENPDTSDWEGHEDDSAECDPSQDEIRNGGYRVLDADDIAAEIVRGGETGWNNIDKFVAALKR